LSIPQIAPAKVDDDDGFDKMLMEAFEEEEAKIKEESQNQPSSNVAIPTKEDIISEKDESLPKEAVDVPDDDKDFYNNEEEYNFGRVFSDNNNDE
ncbi:4572_t:CDS:1, partial [Acaulospora morrowiae]